MSSPLKNERPGTRKGLVNTGSVAIQHDFDRLKDPSLIKDNPEQERIVQLQLRTKATRTITAKIENERKVAVLDFLEDNRFTLHLAPGPYMVVATLIPYSSLDFHVTSAATNDSLQTFPIPLGGLRQIIRDYNEMCASYFDAICNRTPSQIETIDMARRALHNDGASLVTEALAEHAKIDHMTARRLFTLVYSLMAR